MLLSVIIPVYNVENYLARCLDSILDQNLDFSNYEIILVNDGSQDKSLDIALEYQKKYANIKVISQENQGSSVARNAGYALAIGDYLYFMDSDDYVETAVFKNLLDLAIKLKLDLIGFDMLRTATSDHKSNVDFTEINKTTNEVQVLTGKDFIASHNYNNGTWWYFVKRDILIKTGISFERGIMIEDGIFTAELLLNCERVSFFKLKIYKYFLNTNSTTSRKSREHIIKLIDNFKFVIIKFNDIIKYGLEIGASNKTIQRLRSRQESYVFFLFVRLLKAQTPYSEFSRVIKQLQSVNVYPIKNFIGVDYTSQKEKILTIVFNNKLLLFFLIKFNSIFNIIK
jgi:glycosyltransferase involved in cell wall biosynthesis